MPDLMNDFCVIVVFWRSRSGVGTEGCKIVFLWGCTSYSLVQTLAVL